MKLEVVAVPVSDVDRAKDFCQALGWRLDAYFVTGPDFRMIQMTPPGPGIALIFGTGITSAAPGSAHGLTTRLPGRAAAPHGKREEETGRADTDWPDWHAQYVVDERTVRGAGA